MKRKHKLIVWIIFALLLPVIFHFTNRAPEKYRNIIQIALTIYTITPLIIFEIYDRIKRKNNI